jgi:hypothetical protein
MKVFFFFALQFVIRKKKSKEEMFGVHSKRREEETEIIKRIGSGKTDLERDFFAVRSYLEREILSDEVLANLLSVDVVM